MKETRNLQLEEKIAKEKVAGVNALDIRNEMKECFKKNEYTPEIFRDILCDDFQDSELFHTILDIASFAAQCTVRRANGFVVQ